MEEVVWVEVVPREPELIEDPVPELGPLLDQDLARVPIGFQTGPVEVDQEAVRELDEVPLRPTALGLLGEG